MKAIEFDYSFDPFLYRTKSKEAAGRYYPAGQVDALVAAINKSKDFIPFLSGYRKELEVALEPFKEDK